MPPGQKHITVVGSLNADLVVKVARAPRAGETVRGSSFERFPGGKGANQAYAAARLAGPPAEAKVAVAMIGQVGEDANGPWLRDNLAAAGVDVSGVATEGASATGVAMIAVDSTGQNQIIVVPGANDTLTPAALTPHHARMVGADVLLLQLEIPFPTVQTAARVGREKGATVILDPAPARPLPDALLRLVDYLTPNENELLTLDGVVGSAGAIGRQGAAAAARRLLARGARKVIVKMGAAGALLVTPSMEHFWPAFPVTAVDSTAAGDAFNAGFAVALAEGQTPVEAGRFASAAAALAVTRRGAQPSMPTRDEVMALLAKS
jgi:ribokinase